MAKKQQNFEQALQDLEKIVQKLENGDLSLDDSLRQFEEGIRLSRLCAEKLEETERRISILTKEAGGFTEKPFGPHDDDAENE